MIVRTGAAAVLLGALLSPVLHAHTEGEYEGQGYPPMFDLRCSDGWAGPFPCRGVDLLSFLPLSAIGGGSGNDVWGWTDPATAIEYALMGRSTGTAMVDLADPTDPVYLGNLPTQTQASSWRDIKVYANHALVVSEAPGHGMQVFDLTRLRQVAVPPVSFTADAHYAGFGSAHNISVNEQSGFAYAVGSDTCNGGLHMIDVRTPLLPRFAGCFASDGYTHDVQCVVYAGPDTRYTGREVCFASNEDTVTVVDVTNKAAPVMLSRTGYAGRGYTHQSWLTEDHAFLLTDDELDEVLGGHKTRTYIWDMGSLTAPRISGVYTGPTTAIDHNLYVRGRHVFEANYRAGLRILRIGNLLEGSLTEVGYFDTDPVSNAPDYSSAWSSYPFFPSEIAIVSTIEQGLFVLRPRLNAVAGQLRYYADDSPVPGAEVRVRADAVMSGSSESDGSFEVAGLLEQSVIVEPSKIGDHRRAVSSLDAAYVLQAVVGRRQLGQIESLACDATGDGTLSSLDAARILQLVVQRIARLPVAETCGSDWHFVPAPATLPNQTLVEPEVWSDSCRRGSVALDPLADRAEGQDFYAVLAGDCTGNWSSASGAGAAAPSNATVRLSRPRPTRRGVALSLSVSGIDSYHAVEAVLAHDPGLRVSRARLAFGTGALVQMHHDQPGVLRIALANPDPIPGGPSGRLLLELDGPRQRIRPRVRLLSARVDDVPARRSGR